ncbi:DUF2946 domain-containing protein [Pseudomonas guariconensis]|uniref:DUF2946 domain-containing protein n=1 Tax=Pseudomonas TaxID=286 RepID=UPI001CE4212D|nr:MULTISPECIES: DUF2946 domain-containing protein [Pseudomonas]MCO7639321.1 DUF2946 domain-containing protein [Pseudomonas sp. S 311-6]MCO7516073.1 DUF2946 domain-containing protein [Pseudomonas putida]MCO7565408.1 DUF2946 domain-containing protein [Pseudomonas mosselii]MCO7594474.1 DUF2946 domain-containing protein [Pseudomonas guariconensis]MCO7607647.1 DUF2946 domain-containing protein [Pseudomonas guariconensis]
MSLPRNRITRSTRPVRRRVGGGWLSLFAMWMIFIGPLVSQSMPMEHHASMPMPMDMSMSAGHHHGDDAHHGDGHQHALWEKCGYCSLLFNCPALPQALSPLSVGLVIPSTHLFTPTRQGHARQAVFPGARSRAPPLPISV